MERKLIFLIEKYDYTGVQILHRISKLAIRLYFKFQKLPSDLSLESKQKRLDSILNYNGLHFGFQVILFWAAKITLIDFILDSIWIPDKG